MEEKQKKSIEELKKQIQINKEITINEWDKYAKENDLLSGITLEARVKAKDWEGLKSKYSKVFNNTEENSNS